ncbi:hypothetical protein RGR602_PA00021 (plasmid) [Rhizobium gallicum bv. gallicum R602sp]|uniref:Uncharacterized protein n=1 Tax=Rhizobium gallicum bv. gallicum R602sp TaxID=1041138 RepID=A0A0B4X9R5_9HYPH|nr:hypothetical protein RGR602_PA00021 [Rhizobium gallicum bv. gallicum R602sp]
MPVGVQVRSVGQEISRETPSIRPRDLSRKQAVSFSSGNSIHRCQIVSLDKHGNAAGD